MNTGRSVSALTSTAKQNTRTHKKKTQALTARMLCAEEKTKLGHLCLSCNHCHFINCTCSRCPSFFLPSLSRSLPQELWSVRRQAAALCQAQSLTRSPAVLCWSGAEQTWYASETKPCRCILKTSARRRMRLPTEVPETALFPARSFTRGT